MQGLNGNGLGLPGVPNLGGAVPAQPQVTVDPGVGLLNDHLIFSVAALTFKEPGLGDPSFEEHVSSTLERLDTFRKVATEWSKK